MRGKLLAFRRPQPIAVEMSDEALVAACSVGENAALGELFDRHRAHVRRFIGHLAASDAVELDDLVQSTFLEVFKSAKRFRGNAAVRTWIFGIAYNVVRSYSRGERRRKTAMTELSSVPPASARGPDASMLRAEQLALLARAIRTLPNDLRVAVVLCDIENVEGVEAARILGVRPGTMWRRLHDARQRLRAALEGGS